MNQIKFRTVSKKNDTNTYSEEHNSTNNNMKICKNKIVNNEPKIISVHDYTRAVSFFPKIQELLENLDAEVRNICIVAKDVL